MEIPQKVLEQYWDINVYDDWHDCTIEYWKERLARLQIDADEVNYSGFYSQGDGACFTGMVRGPQMQKFMRMHGMRERFRAIYDGCKHFNVAVDVSRNSHHYSHPYCVSVNVEMEYPGWAEQSEDMRDVMVWTLYQEAESDFKFFEEECTDILRGYMEKIYRELEKEYDYLTSEEAVTEAILANELYDPNELTEEE